MTDFRGGEIVIKWDYQKVGKLSITIRHFQKKLKSIYYTLANGHGTHASGNKRHPCKSRS